MIPSFRYIENESFIHRLNPMVKIVFLICYCILVLLLENPIIGIILFVLVLVAYKLAGLTLSFFARKMRIIIIFAFLLFVAQVLFVKTGDTLFYLIPGQHALVTTGGIVGGINMALRFLCIISSSYLFIATTEPNALAYSLIQAGLPYRYGFMLITALRFMPVFGAESNIIRNAQLARGVELDGRAPSKIVKMARYMFLPLIVSSLTKVDSLTTSMEGRGFGLYRKRSYLKEDRLSRMDLAISVVLVISTVSLIVAFRFLLPISVTHYMPF